jgi:hypothetical protein
MITEEHNTKGPRLASRSTRCARLSNCGARRYARGWLCVDVLTSLPFDRILCAASAGGLGYVRFIKILRLLKVRGGAGERRRDPDR